MSEEKQAVDEKPADEEIETAADTEAEKTVKKGTVIVLALILISTIWYLFADRFTPYTQQARVQGYVVGVAPKVAGVVTDVWVKNNQKVEMGQRLFQIDRDQYEIALKRAQSDLENAQRQVGAGTAGIDSAQANLRAALANQLKAQQDITRLERLYKDDPGTISVRRLEISRATLKQSTAQVSQAEAEIQRAIEQRGGDIDDNAVLKAALSAVEKAKLDLTNTTVIASTKGIITDLRAEVGQYAGTGSAVMTLIAIDDVWISAEFTENNMGHMQVGTPVDFVLDSIPGKVFPGKVRSLGLGVSSGQQPAAGTLPTIDNNRDWLRQSQRFPVVISLQLDQPDQLDQIISNLRIGGQAEVMAYSEGHGMLKLLGKVFIRFMSWLSYAY